jgi:hypothetical protein
MVAFCRITKRMELAKKLHLSRFTAMSGKMAAIVAHIVGERWTSPAIVGLMATSDGHLLACHEGDCGCNDYLGTVDNLKSNWARLLEVADLTPEERQEADRLFQRVMVD